MTGPDANLIKKYRVVFNCFWQTAANFVFLSCTVCLSSEYINIKIKNQKFVFNKKNWISKNQVTITLL
jgi:hypothetical protein